MINKELVTLIQSGKRERLPELCERVGRLWSSRPTRRLVLLASMSGVEFGNLYNAGYLALVTTIETYAPRCQTCFYQLDGLGAAEVRESPPR